MSFNEIWTADDEHDWNRLLHRYWSLVQIDNIQLEYSLNRLSSDRLAKTDSRSWFSFLHDEYFVWKYTAKNRLATTRAHLRKYLDHDELDDLDSIRQLILHVDVADIEGALEIAMRIRGLGTAGASRLLSLLYPADFATVDQFVVKALLEVDEYRTRAETMNPEGLTSDDSVLLTRIMRSKASQLNSAFESSFWTPRTVEMALWAYRSP